MRLLIRLESLLANDNISISSIMEAAEVPIAKVKHVWARTILEWVILGERNTRMGDLTSF